MKRSLNSILIALGTMLTLALFQNCGGKSGISLNDSLFGSKMSNGGGYDGKILVYEHRSQDQTCIDGSNIHSTVEQHGDQFFKVREDCREISPRLLTNREFDLPPHNMRYGSIAGRLFQLRENIAPDTEIICRGSGPSRAEPNATDKIDIWINKNSLGNFSGRILIGRYDSLGQLKEVIEGQEFKVTRNTLRTSLTNEVDYWAEINGQRNFALTVQISDLTGRFRSMIVEPQPAPLQSLTSPSATPSLNSTPRDPLAIVDSLRQNLVDGVLNCAVQDNWENLLF